MSKKCGVGEEQPVQHFSVQGGAQGPRSAKIQTAQPPQEGIKSTRSAKNQAAVVAAAAAAKLERFARTSLTPTKGTHPQQLTQARSTGVRKSQGGGQGSASPSAAVKLNAKTVSTKGAGGGKINTVTAVIAVLPPVLPPVNITQTNMEGAPIERKEEPTLRDLLQAINACRDSITGLDVELKSIKGELLSMGDRVSKTVEKMTVLEERLSTVEDDLYPLKQVVTDMKKQMDIHAAKIDDLENRNRRNNVRIIGMPEQSEGANVIAFLEEWLREIFGATSFSPFFGIERAHRTPFKPQSANKYPRPLLFKMFNYIDKVTLLRKAREKGDIFYNGTRISFYQDFSPDLQRRRGEFIPVKRMLQQHKLDYALLYPARLRVKAKDGTKFFDTPKGVEKWLEENKRDC